VAGLGRANRIFTRFNAVDEIAHVVVAEIDAFGVLGKFLREKLPVACLDDASRDPDPTVGAVELDAVLLAVGVFDAAVPLAGRGALAGMDDTVGVGICHFVLAGRGETAGDHVNELLALDTDGTGTVHLQRPEYDIVVVCPPVGHRAAGIFPPVAEAEVRLLFDVFDFWRLAEPEIIVESFRDRRGFERALSQAGGEPDFDFLYFPDSPVADQIAG